MRDIEVREGSQAAEARRGAVAVARLHGFGEEDTGRVAIVAMELATNLVKHGGGGHLLIGAYDDDTGAGVQCLALDKGSGMADVAASLRDGHSTAGSAGTGLGAVMRGSHVTDIYSAPGLGTAILVRFQTGQPGAPRAVAQASFGAIDIAMPGEEVCGDAWSTRADARGIEVVVADGLGHGPSAAEASHAAVKNFLRAEGRAPDRMLEEMHTALRPTRGAAVSIARIDNEAGVISFAGLGNVAGTIIGSDGGVRRMISNNGTVGHVARHIRTFPYPFEGRPLVVLASDGLATSWNLGNYPGLMERHPALIAGVLYRDFTRGRDDVTVLVARARRT